MTRSCPYVTRDARDVASFREPKWIAFHDGLFTRAAIGLFFIAKGASVTGLHKDSNQKYAADVTVRSYETSQGTAQLENL